MGIEPVYKQRNLRLLPQLVTILVTFMRNPLRCDVKVFCLMSVFATFVAVDGDSTTDFGLIPIPSLHYYSILFQITPIIQLDPISTCH